MLALSVTGSSVLRPRVEVPHTVAIEPSGITNPSRSLNSTRVRPDRFSQSSRRNRLRVASMPLVELFTESAICRSLALRDKCPIFLRGGEYGRGNRLGGREVQHNPGKPGTAYSSADSRWSEPGKRFAAKENRRYFRLETRSPKSGSSLNLLSQVVYMMPTAPGVLSRDSSQPSTFFMSSAS